MSNTSKFITLTVVVILAMLACNLPGGRPTPTAEPQEPSTNQESDPPEEPPAQDPTTEEDSQPQQDPPTQEAETEEPAADCTPDSEFIDDVTIPDGTLVEPGETVTKTWRIRNDGTCTWTSAYVWEQINYDDTILKASARTMPLPADIAPGETLDISVQLTLSASADIGSRQVARFQMRSPDGDLFGTHPFALILAAPGTGVCPLGSADQSTFINVAERFCFLYPKDYDAYVGASDNTIVRAPGTPGVNEEILPHVSITNEGNTGGLNLTNWANQLVDDWKVLGSTPDVDNIQVGGMPAKQTDDLPGMVGNRIVFLVHDGTGYVFTVMPVDDAFGDKKDDALALWEMLRTSFTFFNP